MCIKGGKYRLWHHKTSGGNTKQLKKVYVSFVPSQLEEIEVLQRGIYLL